MNDVIRATIIAYQDCNVIASGLCEYPSRDLDFRASQWVDYSTARSAYHHAIERGYNVFKPRLIRKIGDEFRAERYGFDGSELGRLEFLPARESSVCLYVRTEGDREDLERIEGLDLRADEVMLLPASEQTKWDHDAGKARPKFPDLDPDRPILRLWWD